MKYYLDRLEVIKALNEAQVESDENYKGLGKAKEIVDNLPTVDYVAELEKLKAEINGFCKGYLCTPQPKAIADDINEHIINKRIAELKGENNEI